jgi:hypothetical protein
MKCVQHSAGAGGTNNMWHFRGWSLNHFYVWIGQGFQGSDNKPTALCVGVCVYLYLSSAACCWTQNNLLVSEQPPPFTYRERFCDLVSKQNASEMLLSERECGGQGIASSSWHVTSCVRTRRGCNIFNSSPQRVARALAHYLLASVTFSFPTSNSHLLSAPAAAWPIETSRKCAQAIDTCLRKTSK